MSMDLLAQIASARLPKSFTAAQDIDAVRILRQAGLVIAFVPSSTGAPAPWGPGRAAQVVAVTEAGREELDRRGRDGAPAAASSPHA